MQATLSGRVAQAAQRLYGSSRKSSNTGAGSRRYAARRRARWTPLPAFAAATPDQDTCRDEQNWQVLPVVGSDLPGRTPLPPQLASDAPVLVRVAVPNCRLQPGEQLRLVGSNAELGGWEPAAALHLTCDPCGDCWTADVALPPGTHHAKLVIVQQHDGSVCCWEGGADRVLRVPHMGALSAPSAGPALLARCHFGNTAATALKVTPSVDCEQLRAAALAAANRAVELAERREQLAAQLDHLVHEVEGSEARIASKRSELQQMLNSELAQLKGQGLVSAQVARIEGRQASPAALPPAPGHEQEQQQQHGGGASGVQRSALVSTGRDGAVQFCFADDVSSSGTGAVDVGSGADGEEGSARSAFELAKQRLLHLLPAEAEAQLEWRFRQEQQRRRQQRQQEKQEEQERCRQLQEQEQQRRAAVAAAAAAARAAAKASASAVQQQAKQSQQPAVASALAMPQQAQPGPAAAAAAPAAAPPATASPAAVAVTAAAPANAAVSAKADAAPAPAAPSRAAASKPQPAQETVQLQRGKPATAPRAPRAAARDPLQRGDLPVVLAIVIGQQVWEAYRTLWGVLSSAALPGLAPRADLAFSLAFLAVATAPLWN